MSPLYLSQAHSQVTPACGTRADSLTFAALPLIRGILDKLNQQKNKIPVKDSQQSFRIQIKFKIRGAPITIPSVVSVGLGVYQWPILS